MKGFKRLWPHGKMSEHLATVSYLKGMPPPGSLILPQQYLVYTGILETSPLVLSDNHPK